MGGIVPQGYLNNFLGFLLENTMRVMVTAEARLIRAPNGNIYARGPLNYNFLRRYLKVFSEVVLLARVKEEKHVDLAKLNRAEGPSVRVFALPCYVGLWHFFKQHHKLNDLVKKVLQQADAFILRVPGAIGTLLWRHLMKNIIPYAVEVVADPWDMFSPGSVKTFMRPLIRRVMSWQLAKQCRYAGAVSYVTEYTLQERYPAGGWATHCSDVELPDDAIISEATCQQRIERMKAKFEDKEPWRVCYVGTMSQLYKAPDILVEAVSECVHKGINLELIMVGDGQFQRQLAERARRLRIAERVHFLGWLLPGKDVFEQLDRANLFVLPSRQEGLPRTVVEAMARGLPCIGSTVGGFPELLAPEDLVPPADVPSLAMKIQDVLNNPNRMAEMSKRNLKKAGEFQRSKLAQEEVKFYKKVAEATEEYCRRSQKHDSSVCELSHFLNGHEKL